MTSPEEIRNTIKVIGFDLDQTLFPKSPEIDEAIQGYMYEKIAEHKKVSVVEATEMFRSLYKEGSGLSGTQTLKYLGLPNASEVVQEALERADIARFLHANKEVSQLLEDLKNKFAAVDLITGSGTHVMNKKLEKLQIPLSTFDHVIDGALASKSDGDAYELWLSYYKDKFKPQEFLYIGDRVRSDYEVPSQFGIQCILVNIAEKKPEADCLQLEKLIDLRSILL